MNLRRHYGRIYGILVALILLLGGWWVVFLSREGRQYETDRLAHLESDRLHALALIETVPEIAADPAGRLGESYPALRFRTTDGRTEVWIDPVVVEQVVEEASRRRRMFLSEGVFFLILLAGGATLLILAHRSQRQFEHARELFLAGATHSLQSRPNNFNYFAYNDCSDSPNNGFEGTFSQGNVFEHNISDNCNYGYWLGYSWQNEIRHNRANGCATAGIAIEHGRQNTIENSEGPTPPRVSTRCQRPWLLTNEARWRPTGPRSWPSISTENPRRLPEEGASASSSSRPPQAVVFTLTFPSPTTSAVTSASSRGPAGRTRRSQ